MNNILELLVWLPLGTGVIRGLSKHINCCLFFIMPR
jgi:hypothetical protein